MKIVAAASFFLLFTSLLAAQPGVPRDAALALDRIEHAFQTATPASIEDIFPFAMTMRLGDSLYSSASCIKAMELLRRYFSDKDSVTFNWLGRPGTGKLSYSSGGKREHVNVDVFLSGSRGGIFLQFLNISNYPYATLFMDVHPSSH